MVTRGGGERKTSEEAAKSWTEEVEEMRRGDRDVGDGEEDQEAKRRRMKRRRETEVEREWGRRKEVRVIGRRRRTSEGEHLPRTRVRVPRRSTASQLPQMFPVDQKRSRGKRSEPGAERCG